MALIKPIDLSQAVEDLAMCEFFPSDPAVRAAIMRLLAKMCPSREALIWLVSTYTNRIGKWHGPAELRGVLCTRFRPSDGVEAYSALPGYTPDDSEAAYLEQHKQLKEGGWVEIPDGPGQISEDFRNKLLRLAGGKVM